MNNVFIKSKAYYMFLAKIFAFIFVLLCFVGCDFIYGLLDKRGAEEKEIIGEVNLVDINDNIIEIQTLLKLYGYDPGDIDGVLGVKTRDAISRFQKDNGIEPSRFVDKQTWEKLNIFKANGFIVDNKLNIMQVQAALKAAGFNPGRIDGLEGVKTESAVRRFQKANGLKSDGKVGYRTLTELLK